MPDTQASSEELSQELPQQVQRTSDQSSRQHASLDISRFPAEILAEIFILIAASMLDRPKSLPGVKTHGSQAWLSVALVCRHWRMAALEYSRVWSFINFDSHSELAALQLERSRQVPLYVRIEIPTKGRPSANIKCRIAILFPALPRICELKVRLGAVQYLHDQQLSLPFEHAPMLPTLIDPRGWFCHATQRFSPILIDPIWQLRSRA